jgi:hypothetical protein
MNVMPPYRIDISNDSMTIHVSEGSVNSPVRWISLNSIKTPTQTIDRVIAWAADGNDAPHLVIERGSFGGAERTVGGAEGIGTMTLLQRADLVLDDAYLDKYYGGTFNHAVDACAKRTAWRRYTPSRLDAKTMMAHAISYTFDESAAEAAFFEARATEVARWWSARVDEAAPASAKTDAYDARYARGIIDDSDVALVTNMFGIEATSAMIEMTLGIK